MISKDVKTAARATSGNFIAWMNNSMISIMLPLVIANFSPGSISQNQSLVFVLTYSAVFFSRPFGALIFPHLSDLYGRKKILVTTVAIMGLAMLFLALCPPKQIVGIASVAFLLLFSFLQGIAAGGDVPVSMAYMYENTDKKKWALNGFFNIFCVCKGIFLANILVTAFIHFSTLGFLGTYSWRYLFLISSFFSFISLKERLKLTEKPIEKIKLHKTSLWKSLKDIRKPLGLGILLFAADGAVFNMFIGNFYPYTPNDINRGYEFIGSSMAIVLSYFLYQFSHRLSPKKLMLISLYLLLVLSASQYFIDPSKVMGNYRLFFVIPATLYVASNFYILPSLFKPENRAFGIGCLFVVSTFCFGMTVITIIKYVLAQNLNLLTTYLSFLVVCSLIGTHLYKEPS
jgi:MHS family proline/betaine transporter-like MFS transporter